VPPVPLSNGLLAKTPFRCDRRSWCVSLVGPFFSRFLGPAWRAGLSVQVWISAASCWSLGPCVSFPSLSPDILCFKVLFFKVVVRFPLFLRQGSVEGLRGHQPVFSRSRPFSPSSCAPIIVVGTVFQNFSARFSADEREGCLQYHILFVHLFFGLSFV